MPIQKIPIHWKRLQQPEMYVQIMFEAIQGEGGVIRRSEGFVRAIKSTAEKYSLLLIADEIQCGNGRSGKLCAYMNFDIKPDIVTSAKGLAAGLPPRSNSFRREG